MGKLRDVRFLDFRDIVSDAIGIDRFFRYFEYSFFRKDYNSMEKEQINQLLDKQRQYFYSGATLDLDFRISALKRLRASIRKHEDQIHAALKKDLGKSNFESYMCETGLVLSEITHMLKNIRSYAKEQTVPTPLAQFHSRSFRKPSPYGVVLIMSPWNYPFLLTIEPLVDAIAAGNTVIRFLLLILWNESMAKCLYILRWKDNESLGSRCA